MSDAEFIMEQLIKVYEKYNQDKEVKLCERQKSQTSKCRKKSSD